MKNTIKNTMLAGVWIASIWLYKLSVAINVMSTQGSTKADNWTDWAFITTLDTMLWYVIGLLYFITLVFALYGWFQILTAAWDEEKVKKWKTTLINAVVWLVVIFLASQIITWIIWLWATTIK